FTVKFPVTGAPPPRPPPPGVQGTRCRPGVAVNCCGSGSHNGEIFGIPPPPRAPPRPPPRPPPPPPGATALPSPGKAATEATRQSTISRRTGPEGVDFR